jgi:myo-inositol-1(or 4)-monophosphatase
MQGAKILTRYYETGLTARHKGEVDLVTQADLKSQKAILGVLSKAFPDHAILAEEENFGHDRSLDGPIWVIDPLDGTTNYAHGFPMFAVSIGYREQGQTQFGLVYHPLLRELFIAHRGKGARRNGKKIHVSTIAKLSSSLVATGFPYNRRTSPENNLNMFCYFEMAAQCVRRAGAAVLDLANLACGRLDGFWEPNLAPWDICAGSLLVEEAGGKITDFSGNPITDLWCREMVASNGKLHGEMLEGIRIARTFSIPNHARQAR